MRCFRGTTVILRYQQVYSTHPKTSYFKDPHQQMCFTCNFQPKIYYVCSQSCNKKSNNPSHIQKRNKFLYLYGTTVILRQEQLILTRENTDNFHNLHQIVFCFTCCFQPRISFLCSQDHGNNENGQATFDKTKEKLRFFVANPQLS